MGFHPCSCGKPFPSGRLSRLKLAVAEGRALCASAVVAAESVSFFDPLMSPFDFELILWSGLSFVLLPLRLRFCFCSDVRSPTRDYLSSGYFSRCRWIYGLAFYRCGKKYIVDFRSETLRRPILFPRRAY